MNKSLYINVLKSNTTRAVLPLLTLAVYCSWLFSLQYVIGVVFTSVVHVYTCVELHVPHSTKMYWVIELVVHFVQQVRPVCTRRYRNTHVQFVRSSAFLYGFSHNFEYLQNWCGRKKIYCCRHKSLRRRVSSQWWKDIPFPISHRRNITSYLFAILLEIASAVARAGRLEHTINSNILFDKIGWGSTIGGYSNSLGL